MDLIKRPDITEIKAVLDDGTEIPLEQKNERTGGLSQCVFFGAYRDRDFTITLRLDFGKDFENREGADPTLDADIRYQGKKYKAGKEDWHHTSKTFDNGEWVHVFEFQNWFRLRFKTLIASERTITAMARIEAAPAPSGEGMSPEEQELIRSLVDKAE
jgi:hypothetical protein